MRTCRRSESTRSQTLSYYKQIDGVRYDKALIAAAQEAVSGRGDGRISKADAEKLLPFVIDGDTITATEQATLGYLRDHFTWTDKADAWFKDAITRWQAGDRSFNAPTSPAAAPTSKREPAVVLRIGGAHKTASYFPADAAAQTWCAPTSGNSPGSWERAGAWSPGRLASPTCPPMRSSQS